MFPTCKAVFFKKTSVCLWAPGRRFFWSGSPQTVAITGGSRGIGFAIAKRLSASNPPSGTLFLLISQNICNLKKAKEALEANKVSVSIYSADLSKKEDIESTAKKLLDIDPPIGVLINCAGITNDSYLCSASYSQIRETLNVNLESAIILSRCAVRRMIQEGRGHIVNISSISGAIGVPGQAVYSATKAGLIGFTKSLAKEVGRKNIRVNSVVPGFIETDMTKDLPSALRSEILKKIPLKRFGTANEVAESVIFLLNSEYVTGQTIVVDGGLIA